MILWVAVAVLGVAIAGAVARAALGTGAGASSAERSRAVYMAQLEEIESDLMRGVLSEADAQALRTEVSRRILGTEAEEDAPALGPRGPLLAVLALTVLAGGGGIYALIGAPDLADQPLEKRLAEAAERYATRPNQAEYEARLDESGRAPDTQRPDPPPEQAALLDRLRGVLETRPDDLRGHRLLAESLARMARWRDAAKAQAEVLRILGDDATAKDYIDQAEFLILAVNGYVSPEAERALSQGVALDPRDPRGRYYSGLGALQAGRADMTYEIWARLLREGPAEAPWVRAIRMQLPEIANAIGRPVPSGPSAEDIEDAAGMTAAERDEMIRGMVARLSDRLATDGGPAEDWARLIRAYGVLGETAQASRIWNVARERFAEAPADLALIRQAARDAEVVQ